MTAAMRPRVSIASQPDGSASAAGFAGAVSVLAMPSSYAPGEFPANIPDVGETDADITVNDGPDTLSLREWIAGHTGHLDAGIHDLQQTAARLEKMITAIHEELETARPLIEKWQHSAIRRLVAGQFPWQQS